MTCRELIGFLDDYISDSQSASIREEFERHLGVCRACREYLGMYRDTVSLTRMMRSDPDGPVPADVPEDLVRAVLTARRSMRQPSKETPMEESDS